MINSIYTHKEIFLREIISNASDAIDKLAYLSLTEDTGLSRGNFEIRLSVDADHRTLTVSDNGIGMDKEELEKNLGTIARSGSLQFKEDLKNAEKPAEAVDIIGQFGVGFYSAFMVADNVSVLTKKYGEDTAWLWQSSGADGYTITECEKDSCGTDVILKLKADTEDEDYGRYLQQYTLENLVKKYSDYIRYPIRMNMKRSRPVETEDENGEKKTAYEDYYEDETMNSMVPIWQKKKDEVTDEEYDQFYMSKFSDFEKPSMRISASVEGAVTYQALLYVPARAPFDYYTKEYKKGLQLYTSGVLIMENCEDLLPDYFSFVKGVVDSPDLSLNISRELLQHDRQLKIMGQNIEKRIKGELEKLMKEDRPKYEEFFRNYGVHIKCGICDEYGRYKDFLRDLLIFYTSEDHQMTLKEYVENMPESQKSIYYASSDSVKHALSLPQCEEVRSRGYEILCLTTPIDEMVLEALHDQDGKSFCNVVTDDLGFDTEEEKKAAEERDIENKEFLDFVKESVGDAVSKVRLSRKLASQPCCLTTEGGLTLEMEKYFRRGPSPEMRNIRATRVLELNGEHKAVEALKAAWEAGDKDKAKNMSLILARLAELLAGAEIEDPAAFVSEVAELF